MHSLKHTLQHYQSVFVLGLPNHETYRIFRSLLNDAVQEYMSVSYLDNGGDKTYILFNHEQDIVYAETAQGLHDLITGSRPVERIEVMYLSVTNHKLPPGFVFIIPPQLKTKNFLSDHDVNPFCRDEKRWLKYFYGILWCDAFPYGELTNKSLIDGLTNWLVTQQHIPDIRLILLKGPDTASSDIETIDCDLSGAYSENLLADGLTVVSDRTNIKHYLRSQFCHRKSYFERQREYIAYQIEKMEEFVSDNTFFSTTYNFCVEDFIEDYLSPHCLDNVFSQSALLRISNQNQYHDYLSDFSINLIDRYLSHFEDDFFDELNMPFLSNLKKTGYTLPLGYYRELIKNSKLACLMSVRDIGNDLIFCNISELTHLEFIEKIKSDKKKFTDCLIKFYQQQCESITLSFLNNQIAHLKITGK